MPHKQGVQKGIVRIFMILFLLIVIGISFRIYSKIKLNRENHQSTIITVATITAQALPSTIEFVLPGNVLAWHETALNARTDGYTIEWLVDIGSRVKKGDLLATLSAPDVDAQLRQAEADLETAIANNQLAQTTAKRWQHLLKTESVSKQEEEEKTSDAKAKAAQVEAAAANRDRLRDLVNFQRIIAPFDGVIMSRTTDIGRLINAGASAQQPLFRLVQADRLRVYVRVPQYYVQDILPGLSVELSFPELPGKTFPAKLLDTAGAIEVNSRTLLIQFEISNPDYLLLPGSYTQVHFKVPLRQTVVKLPVNTLIFRAQGLQVATIDKDNKAILKNITVARDNGNELDISYGVKPGEQIIINPPDSLINGAKVAVTSHITAKTLDKDGL